MHQNPFSAGALLWTPVYDAPPDSYSAGEGTPRAEIPIVGIRAEIPIMGISALGVPSEGGRNKANMSWIFLKIFPGISWKSPGNLLD